MWAAPKCPYCGQPSKLVSGSAVYPRRPDLAAKPVWACFTCDAWVGYHPGGTMPLGRLADKALREAKMRAHAAFDPLWRERMRRDGMGKGRARAKAYAWLAKELNVPAEHCHIGMFDVALCCRVVDVCARVALKPAGRAT
jgi:hypothetical protein